MADWKLHLYHQSPPFIRNFAATLRGFQLRGWRYGPETEDLIAEALERDRWSSDRWNDYQEGRLSFVLDRAAKAVPFYREHWAERRRHGDRSSWGYLEHWPILRKESVRQYPRRFVAEDANTRTMYADSTSGTTGTPLKLFISKRDLRHWYALSEARWRRWYNLSVHENWGILGGQPVVPASRVKPPFWVWNAAQNQLYLSANHVNSQNARHYVDAMLKFHITHLIAYPSSVTFLAEQMDKQGLSLGPSSTLRAIVSNAEPLSEWQRRILNRLFGCPVYETYGMGEMVIGASADEYDRLRLWPEPGYLEILADDGDQPVNRGEVGRLVSTSLLNSNMPLVRYEVGDRSGLSTEEIKPDDIRRNPILLPIQGRTADALVKRDGTRVFWINPVFYGLPIVEAQVVQEALDHISVRYVSSGSSDDVIRRNVSIRLRERLGDIDVTFERLTKIPRGANGKFRAVICALDPEDELPILKS